MGIYICETVGRTEQGNVVICGQEIEYTQGTEYPITCPKCGVIIKSGCFRCGIPLVRANERNSIYSLIPEAVGIRDKDAQIALIDNRPELEKLEKPDLSDDELDGTDITENYQAVEDKHGKRVEQIVPPNTVRVIHRIKSVPQQKTAILCRECFDSKTDVPIWGSVEQIDNAKVKEAEALQSRQEQRIVGLPMYPSDDVLPDGLKQTKPKGD